MRFLAFRVLGVTAVVSACTQAPAPSPAPPSAPATRIASPRVPADTVTIAQIGREGAVLEYFRGMFKDGGLALPACFDDFTRRIEDQYQIEVGADRNVQILFGSFDRAAAEACAIAVHAQSGVRLTVEPDGALSKVTQALPRGARVGWAGWSRDAVVVSGDPDVTRAVLADLRPLAADAPLARLWARSSGPMRMATLRDYSSKLLGVPSAGAFLEATGDPKDRASFHVGARLVYATDDAATHALAALAAAPQRDGASPDVARVVELLAARRDGRELVVDLTGLFTAPDGLQVLQSVVGAP